MWTDSKIDSTKAFSSQPLASTIFFSLTETNTGNTDKSLMDNVSCLAQVCVYLFFVWFDKTCSCELAKVDSLFLRNLRPRLHQTRRAGTLNELISDSIASCQGILWVYIPNPCCSRARTSSQWQQNGWGKHKHIIIKTRWISTSRTSASFRAWAQREVSPQENMLTTLT